jgi:hypothetical protein
LRRFRTERYGEASGNARIVLMSPGLRA